MKPRLIKINKIWPMAYLGGVNQKLKEAAAEKSEAENG